MPNSKPSAPRRGGGGCSVPRRADGLPEPQSATLLASTAEQAPDSPLVATVADGGLRVRLPPWEWVLFAAGMLLILAAIFLVLTGRL